MMDRTLGVGSTMAPVDAPFAVKPLSPAIGVEITGVDCSGDVSVDILEQIISAWHDNCVALFRQQDLSEIEQAEFCARIGPLGPNTFQNPGVSFTPGVMYISNIRENGELIGALPDGEMEFHSDKCYTADPSVATVLYAIEIPTQGGDTLYANMFAAYDALPDDVKAKIDGRDVMFAYDYDGHPTDRVVDISDDMPHALHPMIKVHSGNGRKALYVNRQMAVYIVDMDRAESDELLDYLFDHCEQPEFVYQHHWTPGDLLIWDNRSVLHARTDFDASERRLLRRVVIQDDQPR